MSNENIYYALIGLGLMDAHIAEYLSKRTGRSKHSWQVKLSNGVAFKMYRQNNKAVKEFKKYGAELLQMKYQEMLESCFKAERILKEMKCMR